MSKDELNADEVHKLVVDIVAWLDDPATHLQGQNRRKTIELLLIEYADRVRTQERRRTQMKDFLLYLSVAAALAATVGPQILEMLGRAP